MRISDPLASTIIDTVRGEGFDGSKRYDLDTRRHCFTAWLATPEGIYRGGDQFHGEGDDPPPRPSSGGPR